MKSTYLQRDSRTAIILSILAAFFSSRLLCSAFVYLGHSRRDYLSPVRGGWEGVHDWWLNPWTTYDSEWYLRIAIHGYDAQSVAFFPLYPWILRIFSDDLLMMALTGVAISHLAFLVALFLVFRLTEIEWDRRTAHFSVWLLAFSPAAPFWGAVYTESVFLMLLAATFLAARTEKWWLAAMLGGLAALCRNPGFLLAAGLFLLGASSRKRTLSKGNKYSWGIPLAAFIAVQAFFWSQFSEPLAGAKSQTHFFRELDWPWRPLTNDISAIFSGEHSFVFVVLATSGLIFSLTGLCLPYFARNRLHSCYLILIGGITLMNLTFAYQVAPQSISATRYMAPLFPVYQLITATIYKDHNSRKAFIFTGLWFCLFIYFSYFFGLKKFLG